MHQCSRSRSIYWNTQGFEKVATGRDTTRHKHGRNLAGRTSAPQISPYRLQVPRNPHTAPWQVRRAFGCEPCLSAPVAPYVLECIRLRNLGSSLCYWSSMTNAIKVLQISGRWTLDVRFSNYRELGLRALVRWMALDMISSRWLYHLNLRSPLV